VQIVADENIPLLDEFFSEVGEIKKVSGRDIQASDVEQADLLLVRSVTQVNEALLANSPVKFVGTCTIGTDHIDLDYLEQNKIQFASAPGCNSVAVVDYVLSVLSILVDERDISFSDLTVAIIGVGNVGFKLRKRLESMGLKVLAVDPFKTEEEVGELVSFEEALQADVISLHTPLTTDGSHPTHHMINQAVLEKMNDDVCLINSCRGPVINNDDLKAHLLNNQDVQAVLDVWEKEPEVDLELMQLCKISTPHIAGYSLDGKMNGTYMVYQACCQALGLPERRQLGQFLPVPGIKEIRFDSSVPHNQALRTAIRAAYEVRVDDGVMRSAMLRTDSLRKTFDQLRRNYPLRRDIPTLKVEVPSKSRDLIKLLESAGFKVKAK